MNSTDMGKFVELLNSTAGVYGRAKASDSEIQMWWAVLSQYGYNTVLKAFTKHLASGERMPVPAHIKSILDSADGRPAADEAWSFAILSDNEQDTIAWTDEISSAWEIAKVIYRDGDDSGARMSFRATYERLVQGARQAGIPVKWSVSLGLDVNTRNEAITSFVASGLITQRKADTLLLTGTTRGGEDLKALVFEGKEIPSKMSAAAKTEMQKIRDMMR